ncbi:MAG TPA: 30S ribosomal protein S9, partial [Syntrophales bacterium]|nr:30S ribosomal protein S9 [Syntrophales bacterium]
MSVKSYYATGKRKTSIARVWLKEGDGGCVVNKRNFDEYFPLDMLKRIIMQPLALTDKKDKFDLYINVRGGGIAG